MENSLNLTDPELQKRYGFKLNPSTDGVGTGTNVSAVVSDKNFSRYPMEGADQSLLRNGQGGQGSYKSSYQSEAEQYYAGQNRNLLTPQGEEEIRNAERLRVQSQIDAINASYANLIREEQRQGEARLGSNRAINARGGLVGSDFGEAQKQETRGRTNTIVGGLEAQKRAEIGSLFERVESRAADIIKEKNQLARQDAQGYLKYLQEKQTEARSDIMEFAKSGVSLDQMSKEQFNALLEQSGYDPFTLKAIYNANKPKDQQTQFKYEFKAGKAFGYGVNPTTGKMEFMEQDLPEGFAQAMTGGSQKYSEKVTPDGTLVLIPDEIDPSKPLDGQVLIFGKEGQFKAPRSGPSGTVSERNNAKYADAFADYRPQLEESRRGGEFFDGNVYRDLRKDFAAEYGDISAFDKTFSNDLSPSDRAKYGIGKATGVNAVDESENITNVYDTVKAYADAGYSKDDIEEIYEAQGTSVPDGVKEAFDKIF